MFSTVMLADHGQADDWGSSFPVPAFLATLDLCIVHLQAEGVVVPGDRPGVFSRSAAEVGVGVGGVRGLI